MLGTISVLTSYWDVFSYTFPGGSGVCICHGFLNSYYRFAI
ncbi:hypothetical protein AAOGI_44600 [Agarivorans albus]